MFEEFENEFKLNDAINRVNEHGVNVLIPEDEEEREEIRNFLYVGQVLTVEDVADVRRKFALAQHRLEILDQLVEVYESLIEMCEREHESFEDEDD